MSCSASMCSPQAVVPLSQDGGSASALALASKSAPKGAPKAYKPTAKNLDQLRRFKKGESIGFTARSSLRAKALLPRISRKHKGLYVYGPKYSGTGKELVVGTKSPHPLRRPRTRSRTQKARRR